MAITRTHKTEERIKLLRKLDPDGNDSYETASIALRISVERLLELENGAPIKDDERNRVKRMAKHIQNGDSLDGYLWRFRAQEQKDRYTIDGYNCVVSDYQAMEAFERRCFECGEKYDWAAWEELPVYATGKLVTEDTTSDVKKCPCGCSSWVAPAYRRAKCDEDE